MNIQYIIDGQEYTTRHQLAEKYKLSKCGGILQQVLEETDKVKHLNQYYFLKSEVEETIERILTTTKKRF
jgi:hypothetical protein